MLKSADSRCRDHNAEVPVAVAHGEGDSKAWMSVSDLHAIARGEFGCSDLEDARIEHRLQR